MPESPEVQALVEQLDERLAGCLIHSADLIEFRALKTRARPLSTLVGRAVTGARRFGKFVDLALEEAHLVVSLGRHGWVRWADTERGDDAGRGDDAERGDDAGRGDDAERGDDAAEVAADPPALASLTVDGSVVEFTDAGSWVSLGLWVVGYPGEVPGIAKLGPDPLDAAFSRVDVDRAVAHRRKQLKAILQEQESFAGIGNAYSDEILHRARLSPVAHGDTLTDDELERLFTAMRDELGEAVRARRGIPIDGLKQAKTDAMRVHGRGGEPCPVCGGIVEDFTFGGTTAQYCPVCQGAPSPKGAE
ncbi:DNA-formamidopyrimidine glycosylase family protein [Microbacterium sp.]|uniref:DNA-formamidopyrimidine glycosylase family protein n=1 Tax=Microbacterium sp. TaxID=51671 RepID=UPI003A95C3A1